MTPPPINEVQLEINDRMKGVSGITRHQRVTAQYADAIREVAAEFKDQKVVLVDLWTAMMKEAVALNPSYVQGAGMLGSKEMGDSEEMRSLLVDGLHLTGTGYKVFLDELLPLVGPTWKDEPFDAPSWIYP